VSVSKWDINGSKTVVMDVVGFACVSLGSSTVQLHDSLGRRRAYACSDAGFSSRNGGLVLRNILLKNSVLLRVFLSAKGLNAKDIHKEVFPVHGGNCGIKWLTTGSRNFLKDV
jgi:hypothetical protein